MKYLEFNFKDNGNGLKIHLGDEVIGEFDAVELLQELNQAHAQSLFHDRDAKLVVKPDKE